MSLLPLFVANEIAQLKNFSIILPMAEEARKPVFHLKPAGGAMGAHLSAAIAAGKKFGVLARELMARIGLRSKPEDLVEAIGKREG